MTDLDVGPEDRLLELPTGKVPGEWADRGLCRTHPDPDLWFPERGESVVEAKEICQVCPVRSECLEHAVRYGEKHGIWGGRSERERRRMRKATRRGTE